MLTKRVIVSQPEIVAPYDSGFQLRHYVISPEAREAQKLVEIVRLPTGQLVKVDVESDGSAMCTGRRSAESLGAQRAAIAATYRPVGR